MKRQILILFIVTFMLLFFGISEIKYLEKSSLYLKSDINSLKNYIENNRFDLAKDKFNNIIYTWNNIKCNWNIFLNHERVDYLEEYLFDLEYFIKSENKEAAFEIIQKINRIIIQIISKQKPKLDNIL